MTQNARPNPEDMAAAPASTSTPSDLDREPVQILVIGSAEGITNIVRTLYRLRFAEVNEWSPLLPAPVPEKLMRTVIRYIPIN